MRIHLTGRITIEDGELVVDESELPKRQGRVAFARLVLADGPVHRDVLAELLWPEELPAMWERTLASVMSRLRRALSRFAGVRLTNVSGSYRIEFPSAPEVDVAVAGVQCEAAERAIVVGDLASAASSAAVAAAIARRPFLAGHGGAWVDQHRSELRAVLVRALETGAEASLGTSEAVALAGEAVELEPFRERASLLVMRAHQAVGNTAEALRAYELHRSLLAEELGADPGGDVRTLHLELLGSQTQHRVEELARQGLVGLPTTQTTFVGRTEALSAVQALLGSERLVTLTGAGGVGKTRMAIEIARRSIDVFPDGVWFADLAGLSADAPIVEHVSMAMGLKRATVQSLAAVLDRQKILLILDNCEQVLEPVAAMAGELIGSTTGPVLLATSRAPLRADGEHVWRVPSMHVPGEGEPPASAESVVLFCDRAAAVRPDFELTSASAPAVASICTRLDGVPLAIELAAARTSAMGATEIAERLHDRFALLRGPASGLPRHRTLRTAIDWSYDLLAAGEARVFRHLSVFEGSFTLEDAEAIYDAEVESEIASLVERSLLVADDGRYRMLETIKEYARERAEASGEWADAATAHTDRFLALVPRLEAENDQTAFMSALEPRRADAVAALESGLAAGRIAEAIELTRLMSTYWMHRGLWAEGRAYLEHTLEAARSARLEDDTGPILTRLATLVHNDEDFDRAQELWDEALEIAQRRGDKAAHAGVLVELSGNAYMLGRSDEGRDLARKGLELAEEGGNDFAAGRALLILGGDEGFKEGADVARGYYERARDRFEKAGNGIAVARAMITIGMTFDPRSAPRSAWEQPLQEALDVSRTAGDRLNEAMALQQLGIALAESDHLLEALDIFQDDLRLCRRVGNRWTALNCIEQIGLIEAARGRPSNALMLLAATSALRGASAETSFFGADRYAALKQRATTEAGEDADASSEAGTKLSFEDAFDLAMSVTSD